MRSLSVCFYDSIAALVEQFKASVKVFEIYCKIIKDNITISISAALENVVMFFAAFVVLCCLCLQLEGGANVQSGETSAAYRSRAFVAVLTKFFKFL